jgi:hypothetical protein
VANELISDVAREVARPIALAEVDERVSSAPLGAALPERSPQRLV